MFYVGRIVLCLILIAVGAFGMWVVDNQLTQPATIAQSVQSETVPETVPVTAEVVAEQYPVEQAHPEVAVAQASVLYNPAKGPLYTIGKDTTQQAFRDEILSVFLPMETLGSDVSGDSKSFSEDGLLWGDCRINGTPVWRDVDNEGEVSYVPANTQFNCEWWGRWYPAQKLRAGDALTREFLAGCGDENHGCQRMAWHWLQGDTIKSAYFDSLPALYATNCGFWVGKRMPAGLSCLVEVGKTATVSSGGSFLTAPDGSGTWTPAAAGSTVFTGQMYIYSPQESSVVSYR